MLGNAVQEPGTPSWGGNTAWEKARRGVSPPMPPPIYTPKGVVLVSFTSKFADNLEWIACKLITVFVIFLHVVIQTCMCFFFEVPRIEELQDPDSSPRREEVGRPYSQGLWRLPTLVFLSG